MRHLDLRFVAAGLLAAALACGGAAPEPAAEQPTTEQPETPAPAAQASTPPAAQPEPGPAENAAAESDELPMARPLEFTAIDGRKIVLENLLGKHVLVFFFSTDCGHCQQAAMQLAPVYADLKDQNVEFLGLAMNPTAATNIRQFVENHNVAFPVTTIDRATFSRFSGVSMMQRFFYPYMIFIGPDGRVREHHEGSERGFFAALGDNVREILTRP